MLILEINAKYDGGEAQRIMTLATNLCELDKELDKLEEMFKGPIKWVEIRKDGR